MKIAVEGCCHGELDKIYDTIKFIESKEKFKVDILLICGDFQAVRNRSDLQSMAVPPKYQLMNSFHKYYSGEAKAPLLTIIIGGNHEASSYMQELPYGGWLAPNIYYLGYAGVVKFGGLRIAGMSGIFKGRDYNRGHYEHPPYNEETKRSVYHVRNLDVFRLKQIKTDIDIFISHDWPRGIYNYGNVRALLRRKKFFQEEVDNGTLGNPAAEELLFSIKPKHWFSAHLHCKFAAVVQHKAEGGACPKTTKFLALDKCLPNRSFLQVLDIAHPAKEELQLELDAEWLCILKSTNHLLNLTKSPSYMPGFGSSERYDFTPTEEEIKELTSDFGGLFKIPENFTRTAEIHNAQLNTSKKNKARVEPPQMHINAQTTLLCEMLGLTDPFAVFTGKQTHSTNKSQMAAPKVPTDDSDVGLDEESDEGVRSDEDTVPSFIDSTMETTFETSQEGSAFNVTSNPDEISLDDIDDFEEDKGQSDSNMDTSTASVEGCVVTSASGSGAESEMNISVTGGNINVISGSDSIVDVSSLVSSSCAPSPISRFGPQGSSTPQPVRSKLVLSEPMKTPERKDSGCEGQLLGKRLSDEAVNEADKSMDDSTPGLSKPKKFKRRNQSIYQDTSGDTE